jgi:hypothetical protein
MAKINKKLIGQAIAERRNGGLDIDSICFPKQAAFAKDTSPFASACCSRRAGKTEACALLLLDTAFKKPNSVSLYLTLTRANAERIVWKKLLDLNSLYNLKGEPNISKLSISFPNGSIIYLSGCNDKSEIEKYRGLALTLVVIDESQSFKHFLGDLIDEVISPALMDHQGHLRLIGTPAAVPSGYFFETLQNQQYSHHKWTFKNNPFLVKLSGKTHEEMLKRELDRRGVNVNDPSIQREFFGEWITDINSLVFHYDKNINDYNNLPALTDYVVSIDIGFNDSDAITVIGWHKHDKRAFLVEEKVVAQQGITELAEQIQAVVKKYNPLKTVMDTGGLGLKIAEELRKRYSLPIVAAEKIRKNEYIEILNDALRTGRLMVKSSSRFASDSFLIEWDQDKSTPDKKIIKSEPHSDICDSVLYGYREALNWLSEPEEKTIDPRNKTAWLEHTRKMIEQQLELDQERQQASENFQDQLNMMDNDPFAENPLSYYLNKRRS